MPLPEYLPSSEPALLDSVLDLPHPAAARATTATVTAAWENLVLREIRRTASTLRHHGTVTGPLPLVPPQVAIRRTVTRVEGQGNGVSPGRYRFVPTPGYSRAPSVTPG